MSVRKLRLCVLTPVHSSTLMGGAEYQINCLLETLVPTDRYEIHYLAASASTDSQPHGYQIVPVGNGGGMPRFGFLMHAKPLLRLLKELRPDVIYQRVACGYTGLAAFYARRHETRLIWHVSSDSDVTPGTRDIGRNPVRRVLENRSIEYGIRHARHIVTQTKGQVRLLEEHYGRTADAVIPNFHPEPGEAIDKTGPITVVWVANLKPLKQPEAFVRLAQKLNDLPGIRFMMIGAPASGSGDRDWSEALMSRIRSTPNLVYVGRKSQQEVNELLARAHVLVNTSRYEGFANTFIQAWLREVPVVSLNVNPDDVLDREQVGIHAGTEEALSDAVRGLVLDAPRRAEFGARARVYARKHHSVRNTELLAQLIDTGRVAANSCSSEQESRQPCDA